MDQIIDDEGTKLANEHIEWFLSTLRPLLFSHFVHGFKHGQEAEPLVECDNMPCDRNIGTGCTGPVSISSAGECIFAYNNGDRR